MSLATIATITKMIEVLPEAMQAQVTDHLRDYIQGLREEAKWDETFQRTQSQLAAAAQRARQEIENGQAATMDYTNRFSREHPAHPDVRALLKNRLWFSPR